MSVVLVDQEIIHYEVLGRGRPVIFLHSWVGSWRYWIPVMQTTSFTYRTYAIDLWGFGDSARKKECYTLEQQVQLLDKFFEGMGIGKVALVGHGLGAIVATLYAIRYPSFVDRVMSISYPLDETMLNPRIRSMSQPELTEWLVGKTSNPDPVRAEASKVDPEAVKTSFDTLGGIGLQNFWQIDTKACLFVHGQQDPAVTIPSLDQLDQMPPTTHAIAFDQSGHYPMLDETNKFNRLLADFLALPSGESPRTLQTKQEWIRRMR